MARNEIRLQKNRMSSGRIAKHRNYSELMRVHNREHNMKRVLRVFLYFLIILFLLIILITVMRWESKQQSYHNLPIIEKTETDGLMVNLNATVS